MRLIVTIWAVLIVASSTLAGKPPTFSNFNISAELESKHIWRGLLSSNTPTFTGDVSYNQNAWTTSLWVAQSFDRLYSEVDFSVSYQHRQFRISALDYYCPKNGKQNEILDFDNATTDHSVDIVLEYEISNNFPLTILASTLVYGDDRNSLTGKNYYSMYMELAYPLVRAKDHQLTAKVGVTPYEGIYGQKFGVANVQLSTTNNIQINSKRQFPLKIDIIANPIQKALMLNFHIGLQGLV